MTDSSKGVVLQQLRYGDTSLIVKVFTDTHGLLSFMIKGASGKHSRFKPAFFQPLTLIAFNARIKPGRDLHFMTEVAIDVPFASLHTDIKKNAVVLFMSELLYKTIVESNPNPTLYRFVHNSIQWLDLQHESFASFPLYFMVELSRYLGFYPKSSGFEQGQVFDMLDGVFKVNHPSVFHAMTQDESTTFYQFCQTPLDRLSANRIERSMRRQLIEQMIVYYRLHLPGFRGLQSHVVLAEISG